MSGDEGSPLRSPEREAEEWGNVNEENVFNPDEPEEEEVYGGRSKGDRAEAVAGLEDDDIEIRGEEDLEQSARKKKKRLQKKSGGSDEEGDGKHSRKSEGDHSGRKAHKKSRESGDGKKSKLKSRGEKGQDRAAKRGEKEMWDHVAGENDSEEDVEGERTKEDDNFIDDDGVDAEQRLGSDDDRGSVGDAPQAEEDDMEVDKLFKKGKKRRRGEVDTAANALLVEETVVRMQKVAEEDAEANQRGEPAIQKLKMLPYLKELLQKKPLQREFLDRGLLSMLKSWLEPLPDGSLPNINIRSAILKILTELPIEVEQYERREMLKQSGLGKVVMFLSKYSDETTANKKLARDIVDMWSRPIFQKSTRYEDLRHYDAERPPPQRHTPRKDDQDSNTNTRKSDDLDLDAPSEDTRAGGKEVRVYTRVPRPMDLDFVIRPESRISDEAVANRKTAKDDPHYKMIRKLQKMAGPKRKNLRAEKVSVEGRGLVKYI